GGGGGGAGGGTGGGAQATCLPSVAASCAPWEECTLTLDGGRCDNAELIVSWQAPADMTPVKSGDVVSGIVNVVKADGGALSQSLTAIPVAGLDTADNVSFSKSGSSFGGTLGPFTGSGDGTRRYSAGWDGGPSATLTLVYDNTPPMLSGRVFNPPVYGGDGGFFDTDPDDAPTAIKKDETITLRVTSGDSDVSAGSLGLSVTVSVDAGLDV